jgi:bifunctional DNA-binding transcriptional regulator/antitoxin component of YhaV-PrlF toxin-antitoxin module
MKAKLQKQQAYSYKGKKHFKHVIVIPDEAITELGWKGGQELDIAVKGDKLFIELAKEKVSLEEDTE